MLAQITEWIVMTFGADVHITQRTNPTDFGDPQTFTFMQTWAINQNQVFGVLDQISQQLLDELPWNLPQMFKASRGWILLAQIDFYTHIHGSKMINDFRDFILAVLVRHFGSFDYHESLRPSWILGLN